MFDDKICNGGERYEEDIARHALAIEHEEEGREDEGRARLVLKDDERHGEEDDERRAQEMGEFVQLPARLLEEARQEKGRGALGKLGRLNVHEA